MKTKIPEEVIRLADRFVQAGFQFFLVGGAVRDILLGRKVSDWDFTTNATPEQIQKLFPKNSFYNNQFGTVSVVSKLKGKKVIWEITTFRKEFGYSDKRHPDKVAWGKTIEEDLSRRDFTIGAIALKLTNIDLKKDQFATEIIDPFKGRKDLKEKIVRAVGDPDERFNEDALRMIRAIRISAQLGFIIEEKTFASIKKNAPLITKVAQERIKDEFFKILASQHPAEGFRFLFNSGLLDLIIPELTAGYRVAQAKHHVDDVWTHSLKSLEYCPSKDPLVRLATLIHDVGKPLTARGKGEKRTFHNHEVAGARVAKEIARRLKLSKKESQRLWILVRWHQFSVDERQTDKAIRRFIKRVGKENIADMLNLRTGDRLGGGAKKTSWRMELYKKRIAEVQKQPFSVKDLKVNGQDVMKALDIPPGPKVGRILKALFAEVEEDKEKNTRKYLLSRILEIGKKNN